MALAWWASFVPGFFSSDSFGALNEAAGQITPAYTATWPLFLRTITFGGRFPALATLFDVMVLTYAVQLWAQAALTRPVGRIVALVMTATPLVGAIGITLWHDVPMTSGLLIVTAVATSTAWFSTPLRRVDYVNLLAGSTLVAFRPNGPATLMLFVGIAALVTRRRSVIVYGAICAAIAVAVWGGATIVTGNRSLVMPVFVQEWMRADLSCVLSRDASAVPQAERAFADIGGVEAWTRSNGCWGLNPLGLERSHLARSLEVVPAIWLATTLASPFAVLRAHVDRNAYLLPVPRLRVVQTPFIHSTIEFPQQGIEWVNPAWSERARIYVRLWNALRVVLAFAGLWLTVLVAIAFMSTRGKVPFALLPTVLMALALVTLLFITAPIPDARYALFVLITGQAVLLGLLIHFK